MRRGLFALLLAAGCAGQVSGGGGGPSGGDDVDGGGGDSDGGGGPLVDLSEELYALDRLPRFDLTIAPDQLDALAAQPEVYARASFRYGDEEVAEVGVRLKGEYTFRPIDAKASFKLKFDEFVPDQRFRGLRRMTLNNGIEDPSFTAERLTYLAFRNAGLPAPRANNVTVYVNGELFGLYVHLETEDKTFLARWFGSDDGNLYEEQGEDWRPGNEGGFELETNEAAGDKSDLTALFAAVEAAGDETLLADVAHILDTDRFLRHCALEGLVNQWDGYAYTRFGPNNYRIYHDPSTGKFSLLPWGMDMSMKPFEGQQNLDLDDPSGLLLARCLASEGCRATYRAIVEEEAARFAALDLPAVADAARAQIEAAVAEDPRKEIDEDDFVATWQTVVDFASQRPASVE